jgi:hypothetical protein
LGLKRLADGGFFDAKKTKSQLGHMLSEKFKESKEEWANHNQTTSPFLHSICKVLIFQFKFS